MRRPSLATYHLPAPLGACGVVALLLFTSVIKPVPVAAHPAPVAHPHSPTAVTESAKVTLGETSIAGPAFDGLVIAWTGTDAAHHLNFRTGSNLSFPNKTTLPQTSPFGPAISMLPTSDVNSPEFALAWTGTDVHHSLNVQQFPGGTKLTLDETSIATPALAFGNLDGTARLLLAWTGTDANHSLNVLPLTPNASESFDIGTKTVLSQFGSNAGPSLSADLSGSGNPPPTMFVLGWSASTSQQLTFAETTDAVQVTTLPGSPLSERSANAPQFAAHSATSADVAWTGTDAAHHLNVLPLTLGSSNSLIPGTKTVLTETALGGPSFSRTSATTADIVWTGTDAAHHLNVASLQGL
jgi:hypothetical protein